MSPRRRGPSQRFPTWVALGDMAPADTIAAVRAAAEGQESILWVHESVHDAWKLPASPGKHGAKFPGARDVGNSGWLICDGAPPVHVAFVRYLGDFAGVDTPDGLGDAIEAWRAAVGMAYVYSGPSTVHALIRSTARLGDAGTEPALDGYTPSAWAVPANTWGIGADAFAWLAERAGAVRCFDRSGSYLAAWGGLRLGTRDDWRELPAGRAVPGSESARNVGYWLIDRAELPDTAGGFDPFRRQGDDDGPAWLTTPLVQLATELAGVPVPYRSAWVQREGIGRPLDLAAKRLRDARTQLAELPAVLDAVKVAYAGATAWFEYGPKAGPLARPHWRRSIIDRAVANTYRALVSCSPGPIALADIDTAVFALRGEPDGLRVGTGLGAWKPKGACVTPAEASAAYAAGGARAVVRLAEGEHVHG